MMVYDWIAHHAAYAPERLALVDVASKRRFTYRDLDQRVSRLACALAEKYGVCRGERVALLALNTTECFEILFACQRLGAIFVPLNWRLSPAELEYILKDCGPKVVIWDDEMEPKIDALRGVIGATIRLSNGAPSAYEEALAAAAGKPAPITLSPDDTWTILYTSGTTGYPKGTLMTYGMVFANTVNVAMKTNLTAESRGLTFMPLFHAGGLYLFAKFILHFGGSNYVMRSFDPDLTLRLLSDRTLGITHVLGVPTNFMMIAELPAFETADFGHVSTILIGGAAAPVPLLEKYLNKGIVLQQGWGMTETTTMGTILSKERALDKIGSCGLPVLHIAMRVVDAEDNVIEGEGVGELLVRGPSVTPGYWKLPADKGGHTADGWFRTGDAVRIDGEGYVHVIDRIKDMYISGGENVFPLEIENVLHGLPQVLEAAVIGIPHEKWGEVGRAFIVTRPGEALSEADVLAHCAARLARFKIPKEFRFVAELPHNATGKLLKHRLPRD
ncbi:long-chain fatty acid--CoA ligase [Vineibacter terrae]|uniref:3-methylmercaptopropionyl-CoA ligase n=1 Tax=Vineibacter terrae TaxID=2586908 RepID=A0A5C8P7L0_9HYPH|nr:AMP-binding protein [Vineibacter terrae]TXL69708.1 long-chain fatty acid--CoA ligase [Vineibacter terrae]